MAVGLVLRCCVGSRERRKGATFEREVVNMFKDELGIEAKRGHQDKAIVDEPDVIAGPFDVECKRVERIRLWDA